MIAEVSGRRIVLVRSLNMSGMGRVDTTVGFIVVDGWCKAVSRTGVEGGQGQVESAGG